MNVLVICGRAARHPWATGWVVAQTCRTLARAGHTVHLRAQSVDDAAQFADCATIESFDTFDQTATDWPLGFARWARQAVRSTAHDVSISFSRIVGGHVWMPIEPSASSWLTRARRSLSAKSLGITLVRHHGFLRTLATESTIVAPRTGRGRIRRVIAVGATAAGEAARILHGVRGLSDCVRQFEAFGLVELPPAERVETLRRATRKQLEIPDDSPVLLLFAPQRVGARVDPLLLAAAGLHERRESFQVLALAKDCFALHARAVRCGAESIVRVLPLTQAVDAALCASDVVALPLKADKGVFLSGGLSRAAATALRFSKPLLVQSGSSGYELARTRSSDQESPGLVVDTSTSENWTRVLRSALDPAWRARSARAALDVSRNMTLARFERDVLGVIEEVRTELETEPDE